MKIRYFRLFFLVAFFLSACSDLVGKNDSINFSDAATQSGQKVTVNYSTRGHYRVKGKLVFRDGTVVNADGETLMLTPKEMIVLEESLSEFSDDDGNGRCSVKTKYQVKYFNLSKVKIVENMDDTYCNYDTREISFDAISAYFYEDLPQNAIPAWRSTIDLKIEE